jgi:NAD(P)H-dependent FMN reductase
MQQQPRILAFAGSNRRDSINRRLLREVAREVEKAGAVVTIADLRDFEMPLYDGDYETEFGLPEGALHLKKLIREHDGLLLASPEYNSSISPLLKNTLDWASRKGPDEQHQLETFAGKTAAMISASPGPYGGVRSLISLRQILSVLRVVVISEQLTLTRALSAFDEQGHLSDSVAQKQAANLSRVLVETATKMAITPTLIGA